MYPEANLRNEFWNFVFGRALDNRHGMGQRVGGSVLDSIEVDNSANQMCIEGSDGKTNEEFDYFDLTSPRLYPTLQEALVAFLIHMMAHAKWPHAYEAWLRVVVLVVADAQREPDRWLQLRVRWRSSKGPHGQKPVLQDIEHTMTICDEWSCLTRDTFDAIHRAHYGSEPAES